MDFSEVVGQKEVKERLMQMCRENRLPHAIMICGPKGCGKLALAVSFACYILRGGELSKSDSPLSSPDSPLSSPGSPLSSPGSPLSSLGSPLSSNNTVAMLAKLEHPDLHFTYPTIKLPSMGNDHKPVSDDFAREWHQLLMDVGPYITMDQWMRAIGAENQQAIITAGESDDLVRKLNLKSSQGGYKVSVIWLPERMNIECANKLLKLIEEPPHQTVFIMVCEEPDKLLETIRSRTQRIDVRKIDDESVCRALMERQGIGEDDARHIARLANGDWLKALEEISQDSENTIFLETFQALMRLAYKRDVRGMKRWSETVAAFGRERQKRFLEYFLRLIRENFVYNFRNPELVYMTRQEEDFARNFARFVNENNILLISDLANRAIRDIGQNANAKIVFFDIALQMIVLLIQKQG